jgi:uncharacterized membrane protein YvlD (DUF360 family)
MLEFVKDFAKRWFKNSIALLAFSYFYNGFVVGSGVSNVALASLFLTVIHIFIQPLLKMILLPFSIITLGIIQWFYAAFHLLLTGLSAQAGKFSCVYL